MSFFEEEEELDIEELDWKIKVELPVPNLDTPIEKAAAAIKLYQARMISRERALKMIDMEDEIEKMRLLSSDSFAKKISKTETPPSPNNGGGHKKKRPVEV